MALVDWRFIKLHKRQPKAVSLIHAYHTTAKDRRASTPLTARLSPNGGHHHARPQRRVPTSRRLSSFFLKTQHGGFPTLRPRQITNNKRIWSPARPPSMLLTFADAHAKRPSRNHQIPYDAHRSATRPNDISAAHARAPNQMRHVLLDDDVAFFRQGNSAKSLQDCRP